MTLILSCLVNLKKIAFAEAVHAGLVLLRANFALPCRAILRLLCSMKATGKEKEKQEEVAISAESKKKKKM